MAMPGRGHQGGCADIYGVLHAITGGVITDKAEEVMTTICGEGNYFTAYDTEGFSQAINDAISSATVSLF